MTNDTTTEADDEPEGSYSTVAHDAIRQWHALRTRFYGYIYDGDLASRDDNFLYEITAKARDHEQDAIDKLRSYGYASGVTVPGIGRVSVREDNDGLRMLAVDPDGAPARRSPSEQG